MHDMYACRGFLVSSLFLHTSPTCLVSLSPNIKSAPSASCPRPPLQHGVEETTDPAAAHSCRKCCRTM